MGGAAAGHQAERDPGVAHQAIRGEERSDVPRVLVKAQLVVS